MSVLAGILFVTGALFALAGSIGLLTMRSFYERVHPPTMASTLGTALVLVACVIHVSSLEGRLILHYLLIGVFMAVTTPVTYLMLVRAALHRDASEGRDLLASIHESARAGPPTAVD